MVDHNLLKISLNIGDPFLTIWADDSFADLIYLPSFHTVLRPEDEQTFSMNLVRLTFQNFLVIFQVIVENKESRLSLKGCSSSFSHLIYTLVFS